MVGGKQVVLKEEGKSSRGRRVRKTQSRILVKLKGRGDDGADSKQKVWRDAERSFVAEDEMGELIWEENATQRDVEDSVQIQEMVIGRSGPMKILLSAIR
ncbi:hypothetical protein F0562_029443 [Nyssa sinensis]|uniref:Uncharacterized protein n=1 Tax=Nyssa sinensis TaxID=561372 RepID=A0A5J5B122_9ASTE|nr:hypothetical protein F0562_029443 [Nyssa sinensis]